MSEIRFVACGWALTRRAASSRSRTSERTVENAGMPTPSLLKTVKPGDHVDVTYREAIDVSPYDPVRYYYLFCTTIICQFTYGWPSLSARCSRSRDC